MEQHDRRTRRICPAVALALSLLLPAGPALADPDGSPAFAPYLGACTADIGGGHEPGLAAGLRILRDCAQPGFQFTGGAEYLQKIGTGELRSSNALDLTDTSLGVGQVTLHTIHGYGGVEFAIMHGSWRVAPYAGAGVSLLIEQSADVAGDPELDWYNPYDVDVNFGVAIAWARLLVDAQVSFGLHSLYEGTSDLVGHGGVYPAFTDFDQKALSWRVGAGYQF